MISSKGNFIRLTKDEEHRRRNAHIKRLLANKWAGGYIIFEAIGEGNISPHGIESESGYLLTSDGRIFNYWYDWNEQKKDYTLGDDRFLTDGTPFWHEHSQSDFVVNPYYHIARKRLGLPDDQHTTQVTRTIRAELESLVKLHIGKYSSAPPIVGGLDQELPEVTAKISKWSTTITNWAKEYLQGNVIFNKRDLQEAGKHSLLLGNKLYDFRNKTHNQAYNPYIDWESSLSILLIKLGLLANLEGKANTIFVKKE